MYELRREDIFGLADVLNAETSLKGDELNFKICPYCHGGEHRDEETFSINLENGAFKCLRQKCNAHGHFVELARDFKFDLDFGDGQAKKYKTLVQKKPIVTDSAYKYLADRGIDSDTADRYYITTRKDNKNILCFPFYDENGVLTCVKYRNMKFRKGVDKNKEWFEKDTKPILFGMAQCKDFKRLIITEGQIDSLSVAACGIDNAVSVPTGANGFTWLQHCWEWIEKFEEVVVFGDYENGHMSLLDELSQRLPQRIKRVKPEDYLDQKDANDILTTYGKEAVIRCVEGAKTEELKNVKDLSTVKSVDLNSLPKFKTEIDELDKVLGGGLCYGQLVLLSGQRGKGKSTFASNIYGSVLNQDKCAFAYSGELADYHFKRWLDFQLAGNEYVKATVNAYGDYDYSIDEDVVQKISSWYRERAYIYDNNFIDDDSTEFEALVDTVEKTVKRYGIKFVLIDNLMTAMDIVTEQNNLYVAQSNFVKKLKKIAVKYDLVVFLIAHPRKSNLEFSNDDVSGSSDITNLCDVVMSYERWDNNDEFDGKLMVTKNRLSGKLAVGDNSIKLLYSEKTKRIFSPTATQIRYGWDDGTIKTQSANGIIIPDDDFEEIF